MLRTKLQAGFTFIEILVVTAILGVLVTIVVVSFVQTTQSGRDARRKKDLAAIQSALEFYRVEEGTYPPSCTGSCSPTSLSDSDWIPGLSPDYIDTLPLDPREDLGDGGFTYTYTLTAGAYTLTAQLEDGSSYVVNSPR